ncbi:PTS transporter subunit EIIB, partial [Enterococcus mundtii]
MKDVDACMTRLRVTVA